MVKWKVVLSTQAVKDAKRLNQSGFKSQTEKLLKVLEVSPFANPPRYEKLVGNLSVLYSRRINIQHRLVYSVDTKTRVVHVLRMWTYYE